MASLFRNTFYTSLAQGSQMLMALVLFKVAAVYLQVEGVGIYTLATTLMFFVLLFDDFGLNTLTTREIARDKKHAQSFFSTVLGLKIVLVGASLLFIFAYSFFIHKDPVTMKTIWVFAVCGLANSFTQLGYAVFRAHERMELETGITVLEKILSTGLGILVLVLGMGLVSFSCMFAFASLVSLGLSLWILQKRFVKLQWSFDIVQYKDTLSASSAFGMAMFITVFYDRMGILLLSVLQDQKAVGLYGAAHKLLNFTGFVPVIFATAFFPKFSMFVKNREQLSLLFTTGFKYLMMLAIPLIPAVFILSRKMVVFFSSEEFLKASTAMAIMSVTSGLNFINIFLASMYGATNHQKRILMIELAGLLMNITCNWILIPRFSYMGSVWATLITEGVVIALALGWSLRNIASLVEWSFLPRVVFASGVMGVCLLYLKHWHLIANIVIGAGIYFAVLLLTKTLDIKQIRENIAKLRQL